MVVKNQAIAEPYAYFSSINNRPAPCSCVWHTSSGVDPKGAYGEMISGVPTPGYVRDGVDPFCQLHPNGIVIINPTQGVL